tara:strand:- start:116 stop:439 length:324 start_codon:yes stop_codon:yes gene_type:complete
MTHNNYCLVYVTVGNEPEAIKLAKLALQKKLVACANLYPEVKSIFEWKKELKIEKESILIFKTTEEKFKKLEDLILKNHTYETPCVLKLPITEGHKNFLDWIEETLN